MKLVISTYPGRKEAEKAAERLVKAGLAACASFHAIGSRYFWAGRLVKGREYSLEAKCANAALARKAALLLEKEHPYSVPMVLVVGANASRAYGKWLSRKK